MSGRRASPEEYEPEPGGLFDYFTRSQMRREAEASCSLDRGDGQTFSEADLPPVTDYAHGDGFAINRPEPGPETYTAAVAARLQAKPGEWVDGLELAKLGGAYAWRSRVSDARLQLSLDIENRQRRVGKRVVSEYRIRPASGKIQDSLLDPPRAAD